MAVTAIGKTGIWKTIKQIGNTYANFTLGVGKDSVFAETLQTTMKNHGTKNLSKQVVNAYRKSNMGEGFFKSIKDAFTPKNMKEEWGTIQNEVVQNGVNKAIKKGLGEAAIDAAKAAKPSIFKSAGKFLWKKMPLIGNALFLIQELPNIVNSFTDKEDGGGIVTGVGEAGKTAIKTAAFALGSMLGGLVPIPGVNFVTGMVGGMLLGTVADKLLGKSFTEKRDEKLAAETQKKHALVGNQTEEQAEAGQRVPANLNNEDLFSLPKFTNRNYTADDYRYKDFMSLTAGLAQ